jgi:CHAT domain-containing protein
MARDEENNSQKERDSFAMKGKSNEHTNQIIRQVEEEIKERNLQALGYGLHCVI